MFSVGDVVVMATNGLLGVIVDTYVEKGNTWYIVECIDEKPEEGEFDDMNWPMFDCMEEELDG